MCRKILYIFFFYCIPHTTVGFEKIIIIYFKMIINILRIVSIIRVVARFVLVIHRCIVYSKYQKSFFLFSYSKYIKYIYIYYIYFDIIDFLIFDLKEIDFLFFNSPLPYSTCAKSKFAFECVTKRMFYRAVITQL